MGLITKGAQQLKKKNSIKSLGKLKICLRSQLSILNKNQATRSFLSARTSEINICNTHARTKEPLAETLIVHFE